MGVKNREGTGGRKKSEVLWVPQRRTVDLRNRPK